MKIAIVVTGKMLGADVPFGFAFELVAVSLTVSVYDLAGLDLSESKIDRLAI